MMRSSHYITSPSTRKNMLLRCYYASMATAAFSTTLASSSSIPTAFVPASRSISSLPKYPLPPSVITLSPPPTSYQSRPFFSLSNNKNNPNPPEEEEEGIFSKVKSFLSFKSPEEKQAEIEKKRRKKRNQRWIKHFTQRCTSPH
mmetsp:Transcript_56435/g.83897  ORF Transcript_56435/g.83897 Transcript_56435/m.83897 type:complete len:144 (+) Transcript_56435:168-599(+)